MESGNVWLARRGDPPGAGAASGILRGQSSITVATLYAGLQPILLGEVALSHRLATTVGAAF